jgi:hypothetical protein
MPWLNKRFVDDIAGEVDALRSSVDPVTKQFVEGYDRAVGNPDYFRFRGRGEQIDLPIGEDAYPLMESIALNRVSYWDDALASAPDPMRKDICRRGIRRSKKVAARFKK